MKAQDKAQTWVPRTQVNKPETCALSLAPSTTLTLFTLAQAPGGWGLRWGWEKSGAAFPKTRLGAGAECQSSSCHIYNPACDRVPNAHRCRASSGENDASDLLQTHFLDL